MKFYGKVFDAEIPRKPLWGYVCKTNAENLLRRVRKFVAITTPTVTEIHMKEKNVAWTNIFLEKIITEKFRVLTLSRKMWNISDRRLSITEMSVL